MTSGFSKSLSAFTRNPFSFIWASLLYLLLSLAFVFAALAIFLIYFLAASILSQPIVNPGPTIPTIIVGLFIGLLLSFSFAGLNGALVKSYREALNGKKVSLAFFYSNALACAPRSFIIELARDVVWLVLAGPALAIYLLYLKTVPYAYVVVFGYVIFISFLIFMVFTPAIISSGAMLDPGLSGSMSRIVRTFKSNAINFVGFYIVFCIVGLLNFVPLLDIATIFAAFPIIYTTLITIVEG